MANKKYSDYNQISAILEAQGINHENHGDAITTDSNFMETLSDIPYYLLTGKQWGYIESISSYYLIAV